MQRKKNIFKQKKRLSQPMDNIAQQSFRQTDNKKTKRQSIQASNKDFSNNKKEKKEKKKYQKGEKDQLKEDKRRQKQEAKLEKLKATKEKRSVQKNVKRSNKRSEQNFNEESEQDFDHNTQDQSIRTSKGKRRIRAEQRAKRHHSAYVIYVLRILAIVLGVVALIFSAIFIYRSDLFHINDIKVSGVSHLSDAEITRIASVSDDSTLLRLDEAGIKQRLCENAWVENVEIKREFPETLELIITERAAAAAVRINEKSTWVISSDGTWLSSATNDDWNNNPRFVDISTSIESPASGKACVDEGILNALSAIKVLSSRILSDLDTISAESAAKMSLNLKNGVSVAFGEAKDIELKEAAIWSILDKLQGKVSYINVHVPSRPTYRCIETIQENS